MPSAGPAPHRSTPDPGPRAGRREAGPWAGGQGFSGPWAVDDRDEPRAPGYGHWDAPRPPAGGHPIAAGRRGGRESADWLPGGGSRGALADAAGQPVGGQPAAG